MSDLPWPDFLEHEAAEDYAEISAEMVPPVPAVSEGSDCPTCKRRVPYKRKPSSPKTQVLSIRIPITDSDEFKEMLDAAATHAGLKDKPHHQYWTILRGLVLLLQGPAGDG